MCPVSACVAHFGKNRWIQDKGRDQGWLDERAGWLVSSSRVSESRGRKESSPVSRYAGLPFPSPVSSFHPQFPTADLTLFPMGSFHGSLPSVRVYLGALNPITDDP